MAESTIGEDWRNEGSALHDLAEREKSGDESLSDEQRWALRTALALKQKFYEDYDIRGTVLKEQRLWAHKPDLSPLYSGRFDEAVLAEDYVAIVDYKFGRKPVESAETNIQMLAYAVLLWLRWPDKQRYAVAVIQPRVPEDLRFSAGSYTPEELEQAYRMLIGIIEEANIPDQPRSASYHACEYCRALHVCPTAFKFFTRVTTQKTTNGN